MHYTSIWWSNNFNSHRARKISFIFFLFVDMSIKWKTWANFFQYSFYSTVHFKTMLFSFSWRITYQSDLSLYNFLLSHGCGIEMQLGNMTHVLFKCLFKLLNKNKIQFFTRSTLFTTLIDQKLGFCLFCYTFFVIICITTTIW